MNKKEFKRYEKFNNYIIERFNIKEVIVDNPENPELASHVLGDYNINTDRIRLKSIELKRTLTHELAHYLHFNGKLNDYFLWICRNSYNNKLKRETPTKIFTTYHLSSFTEFVAYRVVEYIRLNKFEDYSYILK